MSRWILGVALAAVLTGGGWAQEPHRLPNIVFILADDLGYGDLGCFGQTKIRTPNLDRLAAEGMRLTTHYSGNNVCAPSRCVLMTGLHPGHAYIRNNRQAAPGSEGQVPVPEGYLSLPLTLKRLGYATGSFGKWGLGPMGSTGDPLKQGIDRFFGFNCQAVAHNHYPTHLWDNAERRKLNNPAFAAHQALPKGADPRDPASYARYAGSEFAPDLYAEEALKFIEANKSRPFFLYYPTTVPHLALQVPADGLAEYQGKFPEAPYPGGRSYLPHLAPRAAYAAMITRMDRDVGRLIEKIQASGLEESTLFVFTSDNGPLFDQLGGTDCDFFKSASDFRGRKGSMYEGGMRVPCIVRWKGQIRPGSQSNRVTGFEDWLPTLMELIGKPEQTPRGIDGISFAPALRGKEQGPRPYLYRESPGYGGQQCVRMGDWKAIRQQLHPPAKQPLRPIVTELYNLASDPGESKNVAADHREELSKLEAIMREQHTPSALFPMRALDGKP